MAADWLSLEDSTPEVASYLELPPGVSDKPDIAALSAKENTLDWLSVEPAASEGAIDLSSIETQKQATPWDGLRFQCMKGSSRVWACDGEYVACRPSGFHDGTRYRHERFLRSGHYKHVGTFDDVQVFKLLDGSPFQRRVVDIREASFYECMRGAAIAAVKRDWVLYTDCLEEIATRIKSTPTGTESNAVEGSIYGDGTLTKDRWEFTLSQIFQQIYMRGGPTQAEVDAGLQSIRRRRGAAASRVIALPSSNRIQ